MTIRDQAYLQGYLHEKTAGKSGWVQSSEKKQADKFYRGGFPGGFQQYIEQAGTHPLRLAVGNTWKKIKDGFASSKEKRNDDAWSRDHVRYYTDPNQFPGSRTRLIRKGQAEAKRLRDAGTTSTETEWNKGPWETLDHPSGAR
jgi:hypothetical protein